METENKTENPIVPITPAATPAVASVASAPAPAPFDPRGGQGRFPRNDNRRGPGGPGGRRPQRFGAERVKPEFDTKIIGIRRVTRVASGGRRFTFSVAVVSVVAPVFEAAARCFAAAYYNPNSVGHS